METDVMYIKNVIGDLAQHSLGVPTLSWKLSHGHVGFAVLTAVVTRVAIFWEDMRTIWRRFPDDGDSYSNSLQLQMTRNRRHVIAYKTKLRGLSPWTSYTDSATATCRRS
jgi:hypothetical protein